MGEDTRAGHESSIGVSQQKQKKFRATTYLMGQKGGQDGRGGGEGVGRRHGVRARAWADGVV